MVSTSWTRSSVSSVAVRRKWITGVAQSMGLDTSEWGRAVLEHGQVKPEHLINLNALGIIIGQVANVSCPNCGTEVETGIEEENGE